MHAEEDKEEREKIWRKRRKGKEEGDEEEEGVSGSLRQNTVQKLMFGNCSLCSQIRHFLFSLNRFLSLPYLYFLVACNFCQPTTDQASEKEMKYSTDDETELHV